MAFGCLDWNLWSEKFCANVKRLKGGPTRDHPNQKTIGLDELPIFQSLSVRRWPQQNRTGMVQVSRGLWCTMVSKPTLDSFENLSAGIIKTIAIAYDRWFALLLQPHKETGMQNLLCCDEPRLLWQLDYPLSSRRQGPLWWLEVVNSIEAMPWSTC